MGPREGSNPESFAAPSSGSAVVAVGPHRRDRIFPACPDFNQGGCRCVDVDVDGDVDLGLGVRNLHRNQPVNELAAAGPVSV